MADVHTSETRRRNMQSIRSQNTKPELIVRRYLFENGFRYRLHVKSLPGKPDIVLRKYSTVIQVHGCFWHGHLGCKYAVIPKTRTNWWREKIRTNRLRDERQARELVDLGWRVITVFACKLLPATSSQTLKNVINRIEAK